MLHPTDRGWRPRMRGTTEGTHLHLHGVGVAPTRARDDERLRSGARSSHGVVSNHPCNQ
jgi:hypothetical protein